METCTNCGATIRSGARFCTTCGTRVATPSTNDTEWGAATSSTDAEDQQTAVLAPVTSAESAPAISGHDQSNRWSSGWGASPSTGAPDPASRFITALDDEVKPTNDDAIAAGWTTSQTSWSHSHQTDAENSWGTPQSTPETESEPLVEPATESEVASAAVEVQLTDTAEEVGISTEVPAAASLALTPDDPRHRVLELLTELQGLVPKIAIADEGTAAMTLTEASLKTADYSDVREVISQVKENPRDIQALSELSGKVERIEALLEEHATLIDAIESALRNLNH
ncbi:MAG: zinc ribbon domain-containing protein [Thermomicrobiales bacterium]|nr:zinc ribbon domain-containing protein [Thermomicrobiales bacterium]